ncbi:MAG: hypothetical protein ABI841_02785 [Chloroflexota bacterium]
MPIRRPVALRGRPAAVAVTALLVLAGCSADTAPTDSTPATAAASTARPTPAPTPPPTPTPEPTPRFTNAPDPELAALFPASVNGVPLIVAPVESFALTPGDVGLAYGELGVRFETLAIAYAEQPRLTVYAVRVDGPVSNEDLEPHLASAGRYVGIAGLEREPWVLTEAGGHPVWSREGDRATAAGTVIYTWAGAEFVFLVIGVNDAMIRSLIAALPGEVLPVPSGSELPSASPSGG